MEEYPLPFSYSHQLKLDWGSVKLKVSPSATQITKQGISSSGQAELQGQWNLSAYVPLLVWILKCLVKAEPNNDLDRKS